MKKNLIYGIKPMLEAITANKPIDKLFIQHQLKGDGIINLKRILRKKEIVYKMVPVEKLNRLTKENHQGVVGFISPIKFENLETILEKNTDSEISTYLLLDGITDPRNFGAIIRTSVATKTKAIIIAENNSSPINEEVIKTSTGAIFNIPIIKVKHLKDAVFLLKSYGIEIIAATEKTNVLLYNVKLEKNTAIIMGNEGKGISKTILNLSDRKIKIPMSDNIDSLNVSVACALFLYEKYRQTK
jgi:23S rRNA (guanosine2251-2'-O)-methyltransferase